MSDISVWHKAVGNKIMLEQVSNPWSLFLVSFLSTDSLNILRMDKYNFAIFFQYIINRNSVFTGRFHADILTMIIKQPL